MYQFSYAEVMQDSVTDAKESGKFSIGLSKCLLRREKTKYGREAIEALFYTRRVWVSFIEDLKHPDNQLEVELRANLISIAIWILKECDRIRRRQSDNYQGIIDITIIIRDGLK